MPQTHQLEFGDVVRKRYVSWDRDEHEREWVGLQLLSRYAPGLAPQPLARETECGATVVVMSRVPGAPLGPKPLTAEQTAGMTAAYLRLFSIRPPADLRARDYQPAEFLTTVDDWVAELTDADLSACQDPESAGKALAAASRWLRSAPRALREIVDPVVAQGDGNVANRLWHDGKCRLVDFEAFGIGELAFEGG